MAKRPRYQLFLMILCLLQSILPAQTTPDEQQIKSWCKILASERQAKASPPLIVSESLRTYDQSVWCDAIKRIEARTSEASPRARIYTIMMQNHFSADELPCKPDHQNIDAFRKALQLAYEIEDEELQYELHISLGQLYNGAFQYGMAAMHFSMMYAILQRNEHKIRYKPSGAYYDMSFSMYHAHEYRNCIDIGLTALFALPNAPFPPDDSLNTYQQMICWNTIGLAYQKLEKPDSAFIAFDHSEQIAHQIRNALWVGIVRGNKGDVYFDTGQYDSARVLLEFDYNQSLNANLYDNAANSLQWLARIDLHKNEPKRALEKLYRASTLLQQSPQPRYQANIYYAYAQTYTALGERDSLTHYWQSYLHLHDSLQAEITKNRMDIVKMRMDNHDQIQTIKILNRQKTQIATTRNFTIVIVTLIGIVGYMWMNRSRLTMKMKQQEALEGKRRAEADAQNAIGQLDIFRQRLLEKNDLIEKWQTAYETKENSEETTRRLSDLSHHLILNEEDWLKFKALFDSVYPGFFLSLRNKVPDITQAEQRMAALSKLKLTAREAANLLGVSPNTVYTTRRRLRQRLGLEQDADLDPFFASDQLG